jgi:hypothetical protein
LESTKGQNSLFSCFLHVLNPRKKQRDVKNKDNTPRSTIISPTTYIDNCQEYKFLEVDSGQSEYPAAKRKTRIKRGADWTGVFTELTNAIRVRHYSRATLKTFRLGEEISGIYRK